jgi:dihydroflavonol-4-reductase
LTTNGVHHESPSRDRVFLTGATGFVGSHILQALQDAGFAVRALVRNHAAVGNSSANERANARVEVAEEHHAEFGSRNGHGHPERSEQSERSRRTAAINVLAQDPERSREAAKSKETNFAKEWQEAHRHENGTTAVATLEPPDVEYITGDLERPGDLVEAMQGCRYIIHCAALYSFNPRDRATSYRVNVTGTAGLLEAAYLAGVERGVLTSSSATLGHSHGDRPATELDYALEDPRDAYHHSKILQERAAFASRLPILALLPTGPVGPGDWKPTQTGKMILDYTRGKMFAKPPGNGGMNLVAVEDVAKAHVAALSRGRIGERYVIGGQDFTMDAIWETLAKITGIPAPTRRAPYNLALTVAYLDRIRCTFDKKAIPFVPLEGVRMSRDKMFADDTKARTELGHTPTSASDALKRAVAWYRSNGYAQVPTNT